MRSLVSILAAAILPSCLALAEPAQYALTVKATSVVGVKALQGVVANGTALLDEDAGTLSGSITQLVVSGKAYNLKKPATLSPIPATYDLAKRTIKVRVTTPEIDAGGVGVLSVDGKTISLRWAARITGGPARAFVQEIVGSGNAVYTGPPVVTDPPPVVVTPWREKITRQMLFVSAPDYFWPNMLGAERKRWLNAVAAAGCTGIDLELGGEEGAINYIKGINPTANYDARERFLFPAFAPWLADCKERGLVISLKFWNANGNAKGKSPDWWKNHAKSFVRTFGSDNLLVLPVNERDTATPDNIRKAIFQGFAEAGFPKGQLIGYETRNEYGIACGFSESHPQKSGMSDLKGSDFRHINCGDSRPAISYRYSDWLKVDGIGGKPKLKEIEEVSARARKLGTSYSDYSFRQIPDYQGLAAVTKPWKQSAPEQPGTGPRIVSLKASTREHYIDFKLSGIDHWKNNAKRLNAQIFINGVQVENMREGYTSQHLKNAYGSGSHGVRGLKTGEPCEIWFKKIDSSERTPSVTFIWPWGNT